MSNPECVKAPTTQQNQPSAGRSTVKMALFAAWQCKKEYLLLVNRSFGSCHTLLCVRCHTESVQRDIVQFLAHLRINLRRGPPMSVAVLAIAHATTDI